MKKTIIFLFTIAVLAIPTFAQTEVKNDTEFYIGYQFVRVNPDIKQPNFRFDRTSDLNGANASLTQYVSKNIGVTGELGANFDTENARTGLYTAMGGLTIKGNREKTIQPFIRGLAGVSVFRADDDRRIFPAKNDLGFAWAVGAGLDVKVGERVKLRLLQADYLQTNNYNKPQNNLRLGAGIVF